MPKIIIKKSQFSIEGGKNRMGEGCPFLPNFLIKGVGLFTFIYKKAALFSYRLQILNALDSAIKVGVCSNMRSQIFGEFSDILHIGYV